MALDRTSLAQSELAAFERDGYAIVRGLFTTGEIDELIETFNALHARGAIPGCFEAIPEAEDPLDVYPRMMHPHRISQVAMHYMLHPKLEPILYALLNEPPIAAQSMFYWKPPSARGQALHQDNYYLRVSPGTCLAAWLALDRADRENGGLFVAPGSHKLELFCPEEADLSVSFAGEYVPLPKGLAEVPVDLDPGDVLFFGGSLIHGSQPNRKSDRFRRSFICHYIGPSAEEVSPYYKPLYRFDGTELVIADATGGGPCGGVEVTGPH
ncbi:MAG TPA: phytanoyl-CoA dioxygenase family protein [Chloroflexota bacterium]|nr:phytanoyl-CoA dioxygenase family protein [Chloroflexota bacterium]